MADGRLPAVNGRRVVGSHHVMVYPGDMSRTVTVPVHARRELKPGTLRSIIRRAGLTVEEFNRLL
ncbi:MAG: type II toxin-antitoxin system HicA family toxin [Bauldia sp.]